MYQWCETRVEDDHPRHRASYIYAKWWSEEFYESEPFKENQHRNNMKNFVLRSEKMIAKEVRIGRYVLSEELKKISKVRLSLQMKR